MNFNGGDIIEDQDYLSEASAYTGGGESIGYLSEGDELPQMGGGHNSAWEGGYVSDGSLEGGAFIQDGGADTAGQETRPPSPSSESESETEAEAENLIKDYNKEQPKIMTIFKDDDFKSDNTEDYKKKLIKYVVMKELLIQTKPRNAQNVEHSEIINNIIEITTITTTEKRPIKDINIKYKDNQLIIKDTKLLIGSVNDNFNILEKKLLGVERIQNNAELKKFIESEHSEPEHQPTSDSDSDSHSHSHSHPTTE